MRAWRAALAFAALGIGEGVASADEATSVDAAHPLLLVTATPRLDAERLADALRTYLDEFHIEVRTAPGAPQGELRDELARTAELGAHARAWAIVRLDEATPGSAEIALVDRLTSKAIVTSVQRPPRDEDLYRVVALKVQSLLHATLAEPSEPGARPPALAELALAPPPAASAETQPRLMLDTAFAWVGFPSNGLTQQGLAVSLRARLGERLEVGIGTQALSALRAQRGDVNAVVNRIPVRAVLRFVLRGARWQAAAGPAVELGVVSLETTSQTLAVRSERSVVPALGVEAGAHLRISERVWLLLRAAALEALVDRRYTAQAQPLLALTGPEVTVEGGVAVSF